VDDEPAIRAVVARVLEGEGYRVLIASSASEALSILARDAASIDLLITDVVMPGGSGQSLGARLRELAPNAHLLFMSGYADALEHQELAGAHFVAKPFDRKTLSAKVRAAIDEPG